MFSPCYLQVSCSFFSLITTVLLAVLLYNFVITVYRLYLSPISKFRGPKFAAATFAYEAYYNILKGGKYTFKIKELHERYGTSCPETLCDSGSTAQGQSSGLTLGNCMSTTLTITKSSSPSAPPEIKPTTQPINSASETPPSAQ